MFVRLYRKFKYGNAEFFILDTRSYRTKHKRYTWSNTPQIEGMLGKVQTEWLITSLRESSNTLWKIVCSSVPLSFSTGWPKPEVDGYDGWTADRQLFDMFRQIRDAGVENLLFITGDVHFPYLLSYDPFANGTPFCYEAGATPLSAIPLAPTKPVKTLNPNVIWSDGEFLKGPMNFGHAEVNTDGSIKISFIRGDGQVMFEEILHPKGGVPKWKKVLRTIDNTLCGSKIIGSIFVITLCLFVQVYSLLFRGDHTKQWSSANA